MYLKFEKWHGCQNDFIIFRISSAQHDMMIKSLIALAPQFCSREGLGVGADGVLVVEDFPNDESRKGLTIINTDGSLAKNCGNGLRCVSQYVFEKMPRYQESKYLEWNIGGYQAHAQQLAGGKYPFISIDMGTLEELGEANKLVDRETLGSLLLSIGVHQAQVKSVHSYLLENPHVVVLVEEITEEMRQGIRQGKPSADFNLHLLAQAPVTKELPYWFRDKSVEIGGQMLSLERGCGYTPACGSGASSAGYLLLQDDFCSEDSWASINMPGGQVFVQKADMQITLAGPCAKVFEGSIEV